MKLLVFVIIKQSMRYWLISLGNSGEAIKNGLKKPFCFGYI